MKRNIYLIVSMMVFTIAALAQSESETVSIPLTSPGQPGLLKINLHDGSVNVEGYNGSEVLLEIRSSQNDKSNKLNSSGLKRIPNNAMNVTILEEDNNVHISGTHAKRSDFVIKVPRNFSLSIKTHHNGQINVSGVTGEIITKGHHGGIKLSDVGGSVIAETHHGSIIVSMNTVTTDKPMAFSTYHGDVDITFPAGINNDLKMKSTKGEILTDFDMSLVKPKVERKTNQGRNEIKLSGWTHGTIGSGGKEFMFTTYHGDILIRKG